MSTTTPQEVVKKPPRTTLEGMIWNANQVLEWALDPKVNGIPRMLFEQSVGLVIVSVVEVGFMFSGHVGTGILLKKQQPKSDGGVLKQQWSAPSAVGLTGLGYGFLIGASLKDLIIFIMDEPTLYTIGTNHGLKLSAQAEVTLGPLGRNYQLDSQLSNKGMGQTISIAFCKGIFAGVSVAGAVLGVRDQVNAKFYNTPGITVPDILNVPREDLLQKHDGKIHMLDDVYDKLQKMQDEQIERALAEYEAAKQKRAEEVALKNQQAAAAAEQAHEEFMTTIPEHDVVEVNHTTAESSAP